MRKTASVTLTAALLTLALGDAAWLAWTITGTHEGEFLGMPPTHRRFELPGCSHFTLAADRLIAQDDIYADSATMLRQLGLLPERASAPTPAGRAMAQPPVPPPRAA